MTLDKLQARHKKVFALAVGSISVGEGWIGLLDEMMTELDTKGYEYEVDYIKEKFGQLRIALSYIGNTDEHQWYDIIDKYEDKSLVICEECGKPGMLRFGGWIRTLCNSHGENREINPRLAEANHVCIHPWDNCSECEEPICQKCAIACYVCDKAFRHQKCARKHMEETKHAGNLNDLVWLVSIRP